MATKQKPSHPSTHTLQRLERAFATAKPPSVSRNPEKDLAHYRADREANKPSEILVLRDEEIISSVTKERWDHIPQDTIKAMVVSAFEEIDEKLERVKRAKEISEKGKRPPKRKAGVVSTGHETFERACQAQHGVATEKLSTNDGHQRARIKSPMALSPEVTFRERERLAALEEAKLPVSERGAREPAMRPSRLDIALEHEDGRVLRWALSRYIVDHITAGERFKHVAPPASDSSLPDLPLSVHQRAALDRLDFVHGRLSPKDKRDLNQFRQMVIAPDDNMTAKSMEDYGRERSGYQPQDNRFPEGVFVGIMIKIGERLHDIYRLKELPAHLGRMLFGE